MCTHSAKPIGIPLYPRQWKQRSKAPKVRVHRLIHSRKKERSEKKKAEIELKNLKLYMENMNILQENEKLRKKATLLHQENLALLSRLSLHNQQQHHHLSSFSPSSLSSSPSTPTPPQ